MSEPCNVDIVIPSFTDEKIQMILRVCIATIRQSEPRTQFNIIVVESGPTLIECGQNITIRYDREKFNYNHALNQGLSICKNEWVVLANNDLVFRKYWMTEIFLAHESNPDIMSFCPWNEMHNWHFNLFGPDPDPVIRGYRICHEMAGWCIIARREIFDKIRLSERVDFWFSDNVYADALIAANIPHALVSRSRVNHMVSQTHVVNQQEAQDAYYKYVNGNRDVMA